MSVSVERQIQETIEKSLGKRENFLCNGESMSEKEQALLTNSSIPLMVFVQQRTQYYQMMFKYVYQYDQKSRSSNTFCIIVKIYYHHVYVSTFESKISNLKLELPSVQCALYQS